MTLLYLSAHKDRELQHTIKFSNETLGCSYKHPAIYNCSSLTVRNKENSLIVIKTKTDDCSFADLKHSLIRDQISYRINECS